jgi:predicted metal-dependent HD superfamily phosphohydrolase
MLERGYEVAKEYVSARLKSELSPLYHYHELNHTLYVLESAQVLAVPEGVSGEELTLLKTAALYHDTGFLISHIEHESLSVQIARKELPGFGFNDAQIHQICRMIMATRIPQSPEDKLSRILCDADLFYLGTDLFEHFAELLYLELCATGAVNSKEEWMKIQIRFLGAHHYQTETAAAMLDAVKNQHLQQLVNNH